MSCPDENAVAALAQGQIAPAARRHLLAHVDDCARCRDLLGEVARLAAIPTGPEVGTSEAVTGDDWLAELDPLDEAALAPGQRLGRYVLVRPIGAGGMGEVWAAFDPELDRRVAIKLLRARPDVDLTERVRREARVLARLSHPNVLVVHEVGHAAGRDFVVTELVEGLDLAAWLAAAPRARAEILAVARAAAAGLAAAHRAGVVHRDVTPRNILVGDDGRVRVGDFGLARVDEAPSTSANAPASAAVTRTGAVMGTPAYMAPEQHRGERGDERSDQFGLCACLLEALTGERAFPGDDAATIAAAAAAGPPRRAGIDRRLHAVIARGLAPEPAERFPSMDALATALERARRSRVRPAITAALAVALVASGFALSRGLGDEPDAACDGGADIVAAAWSDADRDAVREALLASGAPGAAGRADRFVSALDDYARQWTGAHRAVCEATHVRGEQSDQLLDARMGCLTGMLGDVRELLGALATPAAPADPAQAVTALPSPLACRSARRGHGTPEAAFSARDRAARRRVRESQALRRAGRFATAHTVARDALKLSVAPVVTAEALLARSAAEYWLGEYAVTEATARATLRAASEAGDEELVAHAWLMVLLAVNAQGELRRAHGLLDFAHVAIARAGELAQLDLAVLESEIERELGDATAALVAAQRALDGFRNAAGPDNWRVAEGELAVGHARQMLGQLPEAEAHLRRAAAITEAAYGAEYRELAATLTSLGTLLQRQGALDDAVDMQRRAVEIARAALGPTHPDVIASLANLASALLASGRAEEAAGPIRDALTICASARANPAFCSNVLAHAGRLAAQRGELHRAVAFHERARALRVDLFGPAHPTVGHSDNSLAGVYRRLGDFSAAEAALRSALAIWTEVLPAEDPTRAMALSNLGDLALQRRRWQEARDWCERALDLDERFLGAEHPDLAYDLTCLGEASAGLGDQVAAVAMLRRAHALRREWNGDPFERGRTALALARALRAAGRPRSAWQPVADVAERELRRAGARGAALLEDSAR